MQYLATFYLPTAPPPPPKPPPDEPPEKPDPPDQLEEPLHLVPPGALTIAELLLLEK